MIDLKPGSEAATTVQLLLASASPARLATLRSAGVSPLVRVSGVDEDAVLAEAQHHFGPLEPAEIALLLARAKAEAVAAELRTGGRADASTEPDVVLGCDSVLELDGQAYGKPESPEVARQRWALMRGSTGVLHTGHWLVDVRARDCGGSGATLGSVGSTLVRFANLTDAEIDAYVDTGEPLRVAGAFTVDGLGGPYVESIEGDFHNVVGVSLPLLRTLLADLAVPWHALT